MKARERHFWRSVERSGAFCPVPRGRDCVRQSGGVLGWGWGGGVCGALEPFRHPIIIRHRALALDGRRARSSCLARYNVYVTGRSLSTVKTAPVGTLSVIFAGGGPGRGPASMPASPSVSATVPAVRPQRGGGRAPPAAVAVAGPGASGRTGKRHGNIRKIRA